MMFSLDAAIDFPAKRALRKEPVARAVLLADGELTHHMRRVAAENENLPFATKKKILIP